MVINSHGDGGEGDFIKGKLQELTVYQLGQRPFRAEICYKKLCFLTNIIFEKYF